MQNMRVSVLADYLTNMLAIDRLYYPGLKNHPGNEKSQAKFRMTGYWGILFFFQVKRCELKLQNNLDWGKTHYFTKMLAQSGVVESSH